ncbi:MAG: glycosyltransferase [Planctomycetaceae bacterium]|jgi:glycosyltransferase involved in cell wall biosynthesis|nr:glycosyltransferase [Planctomycetaceae bacterium]
MIPEISVITATYEADVDAIQATIDSVASQNRGFAIEHLIIDGGSKTFDIKDIVEHNEHYGTITYWVSEPDNNVYEAFNKGIKAASGKWIVFLGAGDSFASNDTLKRVFPILNETPDDIRVVYGQALSEPNILINQNEDWSVYKTKVRRDGFFFAHQAVFHRSTLFEEYGGFDESFRILGDNELLRRELMTREAVSVNFPIAIQPFGGLSSCPKMLPCFLSEATRIYRRYPLEAGFHHRIYVGTKQLIEFFETRFSSRFIRFLSWFYLRPFIVIWSPVQALKEFVRKRD